MKNGQAGRSSDLVQKMLVLCETESGTQIDELLQAGASGHKRARHDATTNSHSRRRQGPCQGGKDLKALKDRKDESQGKNTEDCAQKGLWNLARKKMLHDRGALPEEEGDIVR